VQSRYWTLSEERAQRDYEFVGYYVRTPPNLRTVSFEQGIVELRHPIKCKQLNVKFDCTLICHCEVAVEECTKVVVLTKANVYTCGSLFLCNEIVVNNSQVDLLRLPYVKKVHVKEGSKVPLYRPILCDEAEIKLGARSSYSLRE